MDDIEKIPLTHAKERSDDWKAAYMSVGIALIFFGSCSLIHSHVGSNTTQNFVVPIYRFHFHSPLLIHRIRRSLSLGNLYTPLRSVPSLLPPSFRVFPRREGRSRSFPLNSDTPILYSLTCSLFVGNFAFNYPVLNTVCSVLHGFLLECENPISQYHPIVFLEFAGSVSRPD